MKTFEERYTAWVDGQLEGSALTAFEQELARRSAAGDAEADRTDSQRLRCLLREHFEAPDLSNAEFFSHQLRERINSERAATTRRPEKARAQGILSLFPWSVARLAGLGAACLFVAGALYYGLEPRQTPGAAHSVAVTTTTPVAPQPSDDPAASPAPARGAAGPNEYAMRSPTPAPLPDDVVPDIQIHDGSPASATALHYQKPNVNVLWTNGLDYLPDLTAAPVPSTPATPAPAPSASALP